MCMNASCLLTKHILYNTATTEKRLQISYVTIMKFKTFLPMHDINTFSFFITNFLPLLTNEVILKVSGVSLQTLYLYLTIVSEYKTLFSSHNFKSMLQLIATKLSASSCSMLEDTILTHTKNHTSKGYTFNYYQLHTNTFPYSHVYVSSHNSLKY